MAPLAVIRHLKKRPDSQQCENTAFNTGLGTEEIHFKEPGSWQSLQGREVAAFRMRPDAECCHEALPGPAEAQPLFHSSQSHPCTGHQQARDPAGTHPQS